MRGGGAAETGVERVDVQGRVRRSFFKFCEFGVSAYLSRGTVYLLTRIPSRSALTRALIIIFALPCRASRPGAATENKKFTCRPDGKTKNVTSLRSYIINAVTTVLWKKLT